jgi:hypothetical protein
VIAALYVADDGPYIGLPGVDAWTVARDARFYRGPWPAVAHPPCERWGKYWSGGPSAKVRRALGDDAGCFANALLAVRKYGGVIEHPAYSRAWEAFDLPRPDPAGGWTARDRHGGRSCHVEQGHYGHPARKATWLYVVSTVDLLPELVWGESQGVRLEEGFHSNEERARAAGIMPVKRISEQSRIHTPIAFRDVLLAIAAQERWSDSQKSSVPPRRKRSAIY